MDGRGAPPEAGGFWAVGDPLTGDPPHERQGWYSIYDTDTTTLALLDQYASLMTAIGSPDKGEEEKAGKVRPAGLMDLKVSDVVTLLTLQQIGRMRPY